MEYHTAVKKNTTDECNNTGESLKHYNQQEKSNMQIHTVWFCLYEIQEQIKLIYCYCMTIGVTLTGSGCEY